MEEKTRKSPKRLVVEIEEDLHHAVKKAAINRNITLRRYVLRALERAVLNEIPKVWISETHKK